MFSSKSRDAAALKEEEIALALEPIACILAAERERLSPVLFTRLAVGLLDVTMLIDVPDPRWQVSARVGAAEALSGVSSAAEISVRLQQYIYSKREGCSGPYKAVGMKALLEAVRLHGLFYGEGHVQSIRLREIGEEALRRFR